MDSQRRLKPIYELDTDSSEEYLSCDEGAEEEQAFIDLFNCSHHLIFNLNNNDTNSNSKLLVSNFIFKQDVDSYITLLLRLTGINKDLISTKKHPVNTKICAISIDISSFTDKDLKKMQSAKNIAMQEIADLFLFLNVMGDVKGVWEVEDGALYFKCRDKDDATSGRITNQAIEKYIKTVILLPCDDAAFTDKEKKIYAETYEKNTISVIKKGEVYSFYYYPINISLNFLIYFKLKDHFLDTRYLPKVERQELLKSFNLTNMQKIGQGSYARVNLVTLKYNDHSEEIAEKRSFAGKAPSYFNLKKEMFFYGIINKKEKETASNRLGLHSKYLCKGFFYCDEGIDNGMQLFIELAQGTLFDLLDNKNRLHQAASVATTISIMSADNKLSSATVQSLYLQICAGVNYLHSVCNIIHNDIKPENILYNVTEEGITIKISDFGFSTHKMNPFYSGGTSNYQAPETLLGNPQNEQSDIWSVAITFIEIILYTQIENIAPYVFIKSDQQLCEDIIKAKKRPELKSLQAEVKNHLLDMLAHEAKDRPNLGSSFIFFQGLPVEKFNKLPPSPKKPSPPSSPSNTLPG